MAGEMERPIKLPGFELHATGVRPVGRPTWEDFEGAFAMAKRVHKSAGFWLADLLRYCESRGDWQKRLDQAVDATGMSEKTLKNIRAVGAIRPDVRRDGVSFGHHEAVAAMPATEQREWLEKAEREGWTLNEMRKSIRAHRRTKVIEGQAVLSGQFRVLYVDCPWQYGDRPPSGSGAQNHYPGMSIDELCRLPVAAHATDDAVMFFWVTAPFLLQNPGPREVIEAWGFKPKTGLVWDKVLSGGGHYVAVKHEHLIICTRGSCLPDRPVPSPDSVQVFRRPADFEHSEKPQEFRKLIEQLYDGPYLELFGRKKVKGWTVFGNDARLWSAGG